MSTVPRSRQRLARRLGWLVVASLVVAAFAPAAFAAPGAVYTSNIDGTIVNANTNYAAKSDVYLTGGPCNGDGQLDDGTYYYMITSPNGELLSTDAIGNRTFTVSDGFITSIGLSTHATHALGCGAGVTGITVQLLPFDNTPNNGNEYKLTIAEAASVLDKCTPFDASAVVKICTAASSKSDNFKVGPDPEPTATPTVAPTATPTVAPTATPTVAPTATPTATPGVPTQHAFPTIGLTDCTVTGGQGSIIVSGFAATNGGELVLNPGAGEIVITANGTYPLAPGTYSAIIRFAGETVAGPTDLVIGACPAATATPAPTGGVGGATATPAPTAAMTLPPTDTLGDAAQATGGDSWRIVLFALAGLLTAALLLTPARAHRKDR